MIHSVTFRRFKRFSHHEVPLASSGLSLLAGGNNSGKSSILHGLAVWEFCRTVIEAEKGRAAFLPDSRVQGLGLGDEEFSPINVPSLRHLWTNLAPQKTRGDRDGYTLRIRCAWHLQQTEKALEFGLALANDRLFVKTTHSNLDSDDQIPRIAYLPPFAGITDRETRVPGAIRRRKIGEGLAGAVLRNLLLDMQENNAEERRKLRDGKTKISDADLRRLRERDSWELLQQALRKTFGAELTIAPFSSEYHSFIRVEVVKGTLAGYKLTRHPGYRTRDLMVEGSGFLQWLSVYALATDRSVDTLLLDEPDAHLHCSLQQEMVGVLSELADATSKQVLVATHSTEILRSADPKAILEVSTRRPPRFLAENHQKVGLLAGLGSDYAPRLDRLRQTQKLILVEGQIDFEILKKFAVLLGRSIRMEWVEWKSAAGHKERRHFVQAIKEEIPSIVALSLRDRDDEPSGTVDDTLTDRSHNVSDPCFHAKKWRRRHIESYLLWPAALGIAAGQSEEAVIEFLRDDFGVAIGESFPLADAPQGLLDVRGKDVLSRLGVSPFDVLQHFPNDKVPDDIVTLLDELDRLSHQE